MDVKDCISILLSLFSIYFYCTGSIYFFGFFSLLLRSLMDARNAALFFAMTLTTDQTLFILYHYGSYANNPVMLRSSKPMVMRDVFLTKSTSFIPNPLSSVYVHKISDAIINSFASWLLVRPLVEIIGWRSGAILYFGSGFFSSFSYLFSSQLRGKSGTCFDCACTSNGAFAGFATLSFLFPKCFIPGSKRVPLYCLGAPYLAKCAYDEYISPNYIERRDPGKIELRNWGFVGGLFFTLIFSSLVLGTRKDFRRMGRFWGNIEKSMRQP